MIRLFTYLIIILAITFKTYAQVSYQLERFEFAHKSMGTLFRIVCYAENEELVKKVINKAFNRVDSLNYIMSDYLPDSELNRLSRSSGEGKYVVVSNDLFRIIELSYQWSVKTNGIFDISIGPFSQLWRRAGRKDVIPTARQIQNASESVGYRYIHIDSDNKIVPPTSIRLVGRPLRPRANTRVETRARNHSNSFCLCLLPVQIIKPIQISRFIINTSSHS